jgi:hypothetical protein
MRIHLVIVIVLVSLVYAGTVQRGQRPTDLHNARLAGEDSLELRQVALQPHPGNDIERGSLRRHEICRLRLEGVRIALLPDQIHHLHLVSTHLPQQIPDQRMQRGHLHLGGLRQPHQSEKTK